jgi:hypothetical protein
LDEKVDVSQCVAEKRPDACTEEVQTMTERGKSSQAISENAIIILHTIVYYYYFIRGKSES